MTDLDTRVGKLEDDVSTLKVETGKITVQLDYLVKGVDQIADDLKGLTPAHDHGSAPAKWIKEVITPQTIAIVLAVLASALGAPILAQQVLSTTVPVVEATKAIETASSPSTEP